MTSHPVSSDAVPILPEEVYFVTQSNTPSDTRDDGWVPVTLRGFIRYRENGMIYASMAKSTERYETYYGWRFPKHFAFYKVIDNSVVTDFPTRDEYEAGKPYHATPGYDHDRHRELLHCCA